MKLRIALAGLAIAVVGWVFAPGAAHAQLDNYKCYQGKDLKNPKFTKVLGVNLKDQINGVPTGPGESVDVQKVKYVCIPASIDGSTIQDDSAYLTCYQIKAPTLATRPKVEVSTQFQKSQFELKKGKLLCVPGSLTEIP